ncbi:MAG: HD-GYP domain-containing protein [Acidimicrobiales bacterium]
MPAITRAQSGSATPERWASRPALAGLLRAAAWLGPVLVSTATVMTASRVLVRPRELRVLPAWVIGMLALGTITLWATERAFRRLLPLAAMLQLSLAFPDAAPSRFRVALRRRGALTLRTPTPTAERAADATVALSAGTTAGEDLADLLARLQAHDRRSRGHGERVRAYAMMLGQELRLAPDDLDRLQWAALLHDVGKLAVPAEILRKSASLAEDEVALMRSHPAEGARLIEPARWWLGEWADAVAHHHEHVDGSGYPLHLVGTDISYPGRIVAVAEAYDAMTSGNSYRSALTPADARAELTRCAGTQFDPVVVRAFLSLSLGHFERRARPLAWLSHLPVLATAPLGNAAAAVAIGTAALLVSEAQTTPASSELSTSLAVGVELDALASPTPPTTPPPTSTATEVTDPGALPQPATTVPITPTSMPEPTTTTPPDVTTTKPAPEPPQTPALEPEPAQPESPPPPTAPSGPMLVRLDDAVVARTGTVTVPVLARSGAVTLVYVACDEGSSWFSGAGDPVTISPQGASAPYTCEFQADRADGGLVSGTFTVVPV